MRFPSKEVLLTAALLCAPGSPGHAQTPPRTQATKTVRVVPNFVTVTDQTMRAPKPEDWLIHRGNYQAWGYSPLNQVNKANVKTLQLVWSGRAPWSPARTRRHPSFTTALCMWVIRAM